jgi:hypothetical protein
MWRYDVPDEEDTPELLVWKERHEALVSERIADLTEQPFEVTTEWDNRLQAIGSLTGTMFKGRPDIAVSEPEVLTYEDCKTGSPCRADEVQVLLYTQLARLNGERRRIAGVIVYPERVQRVDMRQRIPIRDRFVELIGRFAAGTARLAPDYSECRYCKVRAYCPDRVSQEPDRTEWEPLFDERR